MLCREWNTSKTRCSRWLNTYHIYTGTNMKALSLKLDWLIQQALAPCQWQRSCLQWKREREVVEWDYFEDDICYWRVWLLYTNKLPMLEFHTQQSRPLWNDVLQKSHTCTCESDTHLHLVMWTVPSGETPWMFPDRSRQLSEAEQSLPGLAWQTWSVKCSNQNIMYTMPLLMHTSKPSQYDISMTSYLGLCAAFFPVFLSINAMSCCKNMQKVIALEKCVKYPCYQLHYPQPPPLSALLPRHCVCAEQHCSQHR